MSFDSFHTSGSSPTRIAVRRARLRCRLLDEAPHSDTRRIDRSDWSHDRFPWDAVCPLDALASQCDAVCLPISVGAGLQTGPIFAEAV